MDSASPVSSGEDEEDLRRARGRERSSSKAWWDTPSKQVPFNKFLVGLQFGPRSTARKPVQALQDSPLGRLYSPASKASGRLISGRDADEPRSPNRPKSSKPSSRAELEVSSSSESDQDDRHQPAVEPKRPKPKPAKQPKATSKSKHTSSKRQQEAVHGAASEDTSSSDDEPAQPVQPAAKHPAVSKVSKSKQQPPTAAEEGSNGRPRRHTAELARLRLKGDSSAAPPDLFAARPIPTAQPARKPPKEHRKSKLAPAAPSTGAGSDDGDGHLLAATKAKRKHSSKEGPGASTKPVKSRAISSPRVKPQLEDSDVDMEGHDDGEAEEAGAARRQPGSRKHRSSKPGRDVSPVLRKDKHPEKDKQRKSKHAKQAAQQEQEEEEGEQGEELVRDRELKADRQETRVKEKKKHKEKKGKDKKRDKQQQISGHKRSHASSHRSQHADGEQSDGDAAEAAGRGAGGDQGEDSPPRKRRKKRSADTAGDARGTTKRPDALEVLEAAARAVERGASRPVQAGATSGAPAPSSRTITAPGMGGAQLLHDMAALADAAAESPGETSPRAELQPRNSQQQVAQQQGQEQLVQEQVLEAAPLRVHDAVASQLLPGGGGEGTTGVDAPVVAGFTPVHAAQDQQQAANPQQLHPEQQQGEVEAGLHQGQRQADDQAQQVGLQQEQTHGQQQLELPSLPAAVAPRGLPGDQHGTHVGGDDAHSADHQAGSNNDQAGSDNGQESQHDADPDQAGHVSSPVSGVAAAGRGGGQWQGSPEASCGQSYVQVGGGRASSAAGRGCRPSGHIVLPPPLHGFRLGRQEQTEEEEEEEEVQELRQRPQGPYRGAEKHGQQVRGGFGVGRQAGQAERLGRLGDWEPLQTGRLTSSAGKLPRSLNSSPAVRNGQQGVVPRQANQTHNRPLQPLQQNAGLLLLPPRGQVTDSFDDSPDQQLQADLYIDQHTEDGYEEEGMGHGLLRGAQPAGLPHNRSRAAGGRWVAAGLRAVNNSSVAGRRSGAAPLMSPAAASIQGGGRIDLSQSAKQGQAAHKVAGCKVPAPVMPTLLSPHGLRDDFGVDFDDEDDDDDGQVDEEQEEVSQGLLLGHSDYAHQHIDGRQGRSRDARHLGRASSDHARHLHYAQDVQGTGVQGVDADVADGWKAPRQRSMLPGSSLAHASPAVQKRSRNAPRDAASALHSLDDLGAGMYLPDQDQQLAESAGQMGGRQGGIGGRTGASGGPTDSAGAAAAAATGSGPRSPASQLLKQEPSLSGRPPARPGMHVPALKTGIGGRAAAGAGRSSQPSNSMLSNQSGRPASSGGGGGGGSQGGAASRDALQQLIHKAAQGLAVQATGRAAKSTANTMQVDGWTEHELRALHRTYNQVDPTHPRFWQEVAAGVPGRTAGECFAAMFDQHKTPEAKAKLPQPLRLAARKGMQAAAAGAGAGQAEEEEDEEEDEEEEGGVSPGRLNLQPAVSQPGRKPTMAATLKWAREQHTRAKLERLASMAGGAGSSKGSVQGLPAELVEALQHKQQADRYITSFLRQAGGWNKWQRTCKSAQQRRLQTDLASLASNLPASAGGAGQSAGGSTMTNAIHAALHEVQELAADLEDEDLLQDQDYYFDMDDQ